MGDADCTLDPSRADAPLGGAARALFHHPGGSLSPTPVPRGFCALTDPGRGPEALLGSTARRVLVSRAMGSDTSTPPKRRLDRRPEAITYALDDLILAVRDGIVRVPPFQRGMRWDANDRAALFDSVLRGFPIGTLLFWRRAAPAERVGFDALTIDAPSRADARYVFDGQQRITTLAHTALTAPTTGERALHYDLAREDFSWARVPPSEEAPLPASLVPVYALLDTARLTDWLIEHAADLTRAQRDAAIDAGKRLREYRVPGYVVEGDDESTLRVIFERVNRSGKRLTDAEVFHALYVSGPRASEGLEVVQSAAAPLRWGTLDEKLALTLLRVVEGIPIRIALSPKLDSEKMKRAVPRTREAVHLAVSFLQQRCHVPHLRALPYILPLVTLARFFDAFPAPSERSLTLLRRWLWRGLAGLRFEGATVDLRRHVNAVQHGAEDRSVQALLALGPGAASEEAFDTREPDLRNARTRLQVCALFARSPRDLRTGLSVDVAAVAEQKASPLERIVSDAPPSELAARIIHPAFSRAELTPLLQHADEESLRSHLIDAESRELLTRGAEGDFLSRRRAALDRYLRDYLARLAEWGADDSPPLGTLAADEDD